MPLVDISSDPVNEMDDDEELDDIDDVKMGNGSSESDDASTGIAGLVKAELRTQLTSKKSAGSVATGGECLELVNPGLFIQGVGNVGLPLSDRDAKLIIGASHKAPFGKGSETIVDENVRKTWELNASQVAIRNPAWEKSFNPILDRVAKALGIAAGGSGISAHLHKVLLYAKGGCFHAHQE